jgi:hypothetical protein
VAVLADGRRRFLQRRVRRVRLRRAGEVDGRLREVQPRLRQADVLHRLCRRHCDEQCMRVGVADVLGGEHDHPPRDEAGVLAALEHDREVVDRRLHVARARRLDPRRDEVVVRVARLVVVERPLPRRVLDMLLGDRATRCRLRRELEDAERRARVAARPVRDELSQLVPELDAELRLAAPHDLGELLLGERPELVQLRA